MAEINWTAEAERWLRDIYDYIAEDNPDAASRVVEGNYEKVQLLRQFPALGHRYERLLIDTFVFSTMGITDLPISSTPTATIDILGVFHGALDINRYLF